MRIQAEEKGTEICDRLSRIWPRTEGLGGGWGGGRSCGGEETSSLSDTAGASRTLD